MSNKEEYAQWYKFLQVISEANNKYKEDKDMVKITKGKKKRAKKILVYGSEGIGKTTLLSHLPNPVFIDTEEGTNELDVARFEKPKAWEDILNDVRDIQKDSQGFQTVVIDTADWSEQMCFTHTCKKLKVNGIEDIGYGKGYTYALENFSELLKECDKLIEMGINVAFSAHAQMRKFEQPDEMGAYDRWELKLYKKNASLLKEWADMVLFCNYKTTVVKDSKTKSNKATGGSRVMYTTHHPCWDAKNRFGLPDEVPMEWSSIAHIFEDVAPVVEINEDDLPFKLNGVEIEHHTDFRGCPAWFTEAMFANDLTEDDVHAFTVFKGNDKKLNVNKVQDYPEAYMKALTTGVSISKILEFKANKGS